MIVTALNRDVAILNNIVQTLKQIKDGAVANKALTIPHTSAVCSVDFYLDSAKTNLVFSDDSTSNPSHFSTTGTSTLYTPPDALINQSTGLSDSAAQGMYYITATFDDSNTFNLTYNNSLNLLFQSVIVASDKKPQFQTNTNQCVIVPSLDSTDNSKYSDNWANITLTYDVYLQLLVFDWANLSELQRQAARMNAGNLVRLALYQDPYRNNNCTLVSRNLDGTYVSSIKPIPSNDVCLGQIKVQCAYIATPSTY